MRFLLFSIYMSVFTIITGSPIDFEPNSFDSNDVASDSDNQPEQLNVAGTQTPPQSDSSMTVALGNQDPSIESNFHTTKSSVDGQPDPGIEANLDNQSDLSSPTSDQQTSDDRKTSIEIDMKSELENCKKRTLSGARVICNIWGIDWNNPVIPWIWGSLLWKLVENIVGSLKDNWLENKDRGRRVEDERKRRMTSRALKEYLRKLKEAQARLPESAEPQEGAPTPAPGDENLTDDAQAEQFKNSFKSLDRSWLQKAVETGLVALGYTVETAELTEAASTIIGLLTIVGTAALL